MKGLYLAADTGWTETLQLLEQVGDQFDAVKAHALTDPAAEERIRLLKEAGAKAVWDDIKGHDTPDMVALRVAAFKNAGADIVTVHASGGTRMMEAAVSTGISVYAVVFLTSLSETQFARYYQPNAVENMIEDAVAAHVTGFICPPTKVRWMREHLAKSLPVEKQPVIVVPGTRFFDGDTHDQQQVDMPGAVVANGGDYLVIGRMVTAAKDPRAAMYRLHAEIAAAQA